MDQKLRGDADRIISASLGAVLPDEAVRRALEDFRPAGRRRGGWPGPRWTPWAMWTAAWW